MAGFVGAARRDKELWDGRGIGDSCDSDEGREGLEANQGCLFQEEQCFP